MTGDQAALFGLRDNFGLEAAHLPEFGGLLLGRLPGVSLQNDLPRTIAGANEIRHLRILLAIHTTRGSG